MNGFGWIAVGVVIMLIPLWIIYKKYQKKQILDYHEYKKLQDDVSDLSNQLCTAKQELVHTQEQTEVALQRYNDAIYKSTHEINQFIDQQRTLRQKELDTDFETRKSNAELALDEIIKECNMQAESAKQALADTVQMCTDKSNEYYWKVADAQQRFDDIERTLATYEKENQEKLFYTIQLPEEYRGDIEFLLTTVAAKVQHPDIISKLVWAEYVKPNLDDTFKRIDIHPASGIYKLTSLQNGKCYIGKSTDVKKRISDHFKSVVGIKSIADQAVHHAILEEGFWNWQIEIITYCDKERLNELEKYYIDFFKSQEFGYNKNGGGGG